MSSAQSVFYVLFFVVFIPENKFDQLAWEQASSGVATNGETCSDQTTSPLKKTVTNMVCRNSKTKKQQATNDVAKMTIEMNNTREVTINKREVSKENCASYEIEVGSKSKKRGRSSRSKDKNAEQVEDVDPCVRNNLASNNKSKRRRFLDDVVDGDAGIFSSYMTAHQFKPRVSYDKKKKKLQGPSSSYFNNSVDNGLYKCSKCDKDFPEELYNAHTLKCLDDTNVTFS